MNDTIEHLKLIQGVINRMARNSFLLKGWNVVLVSALFALAASNTDIFIVCLAYFPAFAFWVLDGYFLRQERLFRALYDYVRILKEEDIDFSMNTSIVKDNVSCWGRVVVSTTLLVFHGTVLASITIVMLVILICKGGC